MPAFVTDTFTDINGTAVTSHAGEVGATWTRHAAATDTAAPVVSSNRLVPAQTNVTNAIYYASGAPATDDYSVTADVAYNGGAIIDGPGLRLATGASTGYFGFLATAVSKAVAIYKYVAGALTQVASVGASAALTSGVTYRVTLAASGTTLTLRVQRLSDNQYLTTSGTWQAGATNCITATDSSISAAGRAGFWLTCPASGAGALDNLSADEAGAALSAGTASTTSVGSTVATVTCTAASGGTAPYTYQWQRSTTSGSGFSNVSGATSLTLNDTGLTNGTTYYYRCVATDAASATATSNETSATPAAANDFAVNNSNLFFSPYNWRLSGSTFAQTNTPGAYLKTNFSGTSCVLKLDTSVNSGLSAGNYPAVAWSVDGGSFARSQLTSGQTTLSLATGLSSGTHTLELIVVAAWYTSDRWNTPASVVRVTGLTLDSGASVSAPTLQSGRCLVYGDSNGEGYESLAVGVSVANQDASVAAPLLLGRALGCEVGVVAFAGQGYTGGGGGNVPALATSWSKYDNSNSRLTGGLLTPTPDWIICAHGQNDGSSPQTTVTSLIAAWRAAAGPACKIAILSPTNLSQWAGIVAGVTAAADPLAKAVTTGEDLLGSWSGGQSKQYTNANHLSGLRGHPRYAAVVSAGIRAAFATGTYPTAGDIAAAVLAAGDVDGYSLEQALKLCLAALAGKLSGAAGTTVTIRAADDSRDRITATVDASGNRTSVTLDAAG